MRRQVANGNGPPSGASPGERCVWTAGLSKTSEFTASIENQKPLHKKPNLKLLLKDQAVWHTPLWLQPGDRGLTAPSKGGLALPFASAPPPLPTASCQPCPLYLSFQAPRHTSGHNPPCSPPSWQRVWSVYFVPRSVLVSEMQIAYCRLIFTARNVFWQKNKEHD